ncbi:MAG: T9SS type A sorting domain-containing protein [Chitinophagales bacterium]|nr:T9SS type A sorting domain-containing protein [Chitinophagales bacterium]
MKKFLITLLAFATLGFATAQNAIPNAGFEQWNVNPNYDDPVGWGTINGLTYLIGVKTVTKATAAADIHSGSFAIKLESKTVPLQGVAPGIAATGTINAQTQGVDGGVVFTKRPIALKGWYKYQPSGVDTGTIEANLFRWNTSTNQREDVGRAEFVMTTTVNSYTQFTANFTYTSANAPDSMVMILLTSSKANASPNGTKLFVDDLEMDYCSNFSISTSTSNATCTAADGTVNVTTTNGVNPINYAWSGGGSTATVAKAAGTYTVTVTDGNACTVTASATVASTPVAINVTASATSSTCGANTGTTTSSTNDGFGPYTYAWSNGGSTQNLSNLGAGNYTVTVTDSKGCTGTASASVTTPNGPSATSAVTDVLCNGGSTGHVDVATTGGTAPLDFLWSSGETTEDLTNVAAGTYTLTITDANNCEYVVSADVTEPAALSATPTATDVACYGQSTGTYNFNVTGGTPAYMFNPSVPTTPVAAGSYTHTITDGNGCATTSTAVVNQPAAALAVTLTATDASASTASDGAVNSTVTGGTSSYSYLWSNSSSADDLTNLPTGNYCVTVTDNNSCTVSACASVSAPSSISTVSENDFRIYPNPASGFFTVQSENLKNATIKVYAVNGALMIEKQTTSESETIAVADLPQGVYTCKIFNTEGVELFIGRILISR